MRRILVFTRNQAPLKVYQKGLDYSNEWRVLEVLDLRDRGTPRLICRPPCGFRRLPAA